MNNHKYTLLGIILTLVAVFGAGCITSLNPLNENQPQPAPQTGVSFKEDVVIWPDRIPTRVSETEQGTYAVNQVLPAETPLDPQVLIDAANRQVASLEEIGLEAEMEKEEIERWSEETIAQLKSEVEALSPQTVTYTPHEVTQVPDEIALISGAASTFGGPWGAAAGLLISNGWLWFRNRRNKSIAQSTMSGIDLVFDSLAHAPPEYAAQASALESDMKGIFKQVHAEWGVAKPAQTMVQSVKTPTKKNITAFGGTSVPVKPASA